MGGATCRHCCRRMGRAGTSNRWWDSRCSWGHSRGGAGVRRQFDTVAAAAEECDAQVAGFGATRLDISDFPTRHNYGLGLWQKHIERILAAWVGELPVTFYRGREVTGFTQDDTGVDVHVSDGQRLRGQYLVGCDGGRSVVRKAAGIEFPGWDPTTSALLAEVRLTEEPQWGVHDNAIGRHAFSKADGGLVGVLVTEERVNNASEVTLGELRE